MATIIRGSANDLINGTSSSDLIYAGAGDDVINAGDGNDTVYAEDGNDTVDAGKGNDFADGGAGNDTLKGGDGNDTLYGGSGDDVLDGGKGNDWIYGGDGNDRMMLSDSNDYFDGGAGIDWIDGTNSSEGASIDLLTGKVRSDGNSNVSGVENVTGTKFADVITGDGNANVLFGNGGNDTLYGGGGGDTLIAASGNGTYNGESGNDTLVFTVGTPGNHTFNGGTGTDTVQIHLTSAQITAGLLTEIQAYSLFAANPLNTVQAYQFNQVGNLKVAGAESVVVYVDGVLTPLNDLLNHAPVVDTGSSPSNISVAHNASVSGAVVATDSDGDTLGYSIQSGPAHGTVSLNTATGAYTYTAGDFVGSDTFVVRVSDGHGGFADHTVNASLTNTGPAVDPSSASALTLVHGASINGAVVGSDADGDTLGYSVQSGPAHGTVSLDAATGQYVYTAGDFVGSDTFVVRVSDGHGGFADHTVNASLTNTGPTAAPASSLSVVHNLAVSGVVTGSDADGDTLGYSVQTGPAHGTVSLDAATGQYVYTAGDFVGSDTFVVRVSDGHGGFADHTVDASLTNTDPVIAASSTSELTVGHGRSINGVVTASDADGDDYSFTIASGPVHGAVTFTDASGSYVYTAGHYAGTDSFTLRVSDGHGGYADQVVSVTSTNDDPVINAAASVASFTLIKGESFNGNVVAFDGEGDQLAYAVKTGPAHGSLTVNADGSFTYTAEDYAGTDSFVVTVSDGLGGTADHTVNFGVFGTLDISSNSVAATMNLATDTGTGVDTGRVVWAIDVIGSNFNDTIVGDARANLLDGGAGKDDVRGGAGNDRVYGGTGDDKVFGDDGDDLVYGGDGNDTLNGGAHNDRLEGGIGNDGFFGGGGNDRLYGGTGNDRLYGDGGNDTLSGGTGSDIMTGAGFNNGGARGANTYIWESADVGTGLDRITDFGAGDRLDFSLLFPTHSGPAHDVVRLTDTASGIVVSVDMGGSSGFVDVVVLDNVHGLNVDDLDHNGSLVV